MQDMLVALYHLPGNQENIDRLAQEGIHIRRAMAPDMLDIVDWVKNTTRYAAGEVTVAFARQPISCFVAEKDGEILGYAVYDATCKDFFGPTRVSDAYQGKGIGKALLIAALEAMRNEGYAYAIIGGVGPAEFYKKAVGAVLIENSTPGAYKDFLGYIRKTKTESKE